MFTRVIRQFRNDVRILMLASWAVIPFCGQASVAIPVENVRLLNGWWGCLAEKVCASNGRTEIVCQSNCSRDLYRVDFCNDWCSQGVLAPRLPGSTNGWIAIDFETDLALVAIGVRTIDGKGVMRVHQRTMRDVLAPGHHVLDIPFALTNVEAAALAGVEFRPRERGKGHIVIRGFGFKGDIPENETLRMEINAGCEPRVLTPETAARGIDAAFVNFTESRHSYEVALSVCDYHDVRVGEIRKFAFELGPGERKSMKVGCPERYGFYRIVAEVRSGKESKVRRLERFFGYMKPTGPTEVSGRSEEFPFGTVVHLHPYFGGGEDEIEKMVRAVERIGLNVIRTDMVARNEREWRGMDAIIDACSRHGIALDLILPWIGGKDGRTDLAASRTLFRKVFARWKGKVKYWELYNEPDLPWGRKHPPRPEEYAKLAEMTRADLDEIDPAATFMSAGFCVFSHPVCGHFQLEAMRLAWTNFNLHCFHGHGHYGGFRNLIDGPFAAIRKEIGATELPWFANETAYTSAEGGFARQAEQMYKKVLFSMTRGSRGYIWYNLRSKGVDQSDHENGYGMLMQNLDPKPAYMAWNTMTELFSNAKPVGEVRAGAALQSFRFRRKKVDLIGLWRDSGKVCPVDFRTDADRIVSVDLFGNRKTLAVERGQIRLSPSAEPVTLVLPTGSIFERVESEPDGKSLENLLSKYVEQFNSTDEELYANTFPNSSAAWFLADYVPFFECPDTDIERTYYFRWWTFRKHIRKVADGWVITEFLPDVSWAGKYNTINCAAGHHIMEGRWLRGHWQIDDYVRFWLGDCGGKMHEQGAYVCWLASAVLERTKVRGDWTFAKECLPGLVRNFELWEKGWNCRVFPDNGTFPMGRHGDLFWTTCNYEGSELALGGDGARVHVNAVMYGEARAIAEIAAATGDKALTERFGRCAREIERAMKERLWNRNLGFFVPEGTNGVQKAVRELHGYSPWYFGMDLKGFESAWKPLMEPEGFNAKWGLTFPDRRTPGFKISYEGHPCQWNGPVWPYATSLTLTALANAIESGTSGSVTASDYVELLRRYAAAQVRVRQAGTIVPWIDEVQNPDTGDWISRTMLAKKGDNRYRERGKDYNHSTFCDLVLSGLVGIRPQSGNRLIVSPLFPSSWDYLKVERVAYHGREISITWDRTGGRYGGKPGLTVFVNGQKRAHADVLKRIELDL